MHGIKNRRPHGTHKHPGLRGWCERKRKMRVDAQIRDILNIQRSSRATVLPENRMALPSVWDHKAEVLTGDTVYLGRNNSIQSFILSIEDGAVTDGNRVSQDSPVGRALLGRHQGDKVRLTTIDGNFDYVILKII